MLWLSSVPSAAVADCLLGCRPQVRVLSASMTIRQMFSGREQFRVLITDHVRTCTPLQPSASEGALR